MIQRQVTHPPGTFPLCKKCGHEPKHYVCAGRSSKDAFDLRTPAAERHLIECFCSGDECRTDLLPSFVAANIEWRDRFAVSQPARRKRVA